MVFEPVGLGDFARLAELSARGELVLAPARRASRGRARAVIAALRILAPGLMTTVQDLGRVGYQRLGIPVGGALDALSLRAANLLVGNPPDAGGLEIIASGPTLRRRGRERPGRLRRRRRSISS